MKYFLTMNDNNDNDSNYQGQKKYLRSLPRMVLRYEDLLKNVISKELLMQLYIFFIYIYCFIFCLSWNATVSVLNTELCRYCPKVLFDIFKIILSEGASEDALV